MKTFKGGARVALVALFVLGGSTPALGAPPGTITTPEHPTWLTGTDTLNQVVDSVLSALLDGNAANGELSNAVDGLLVYAGLGSSCGELEMEGSPTSAMPFCLPNDANGLPDNNPGCQEMAPMSRVLDTSICEDEESVGKAEGFAFCADSLVVLTDNAGHQRFADTAAECPVPNPQTTPNNDTDGDGGPEFADGATGNLRTGGSIPGTSYTIGTGFTPRNEWKDVLRIIYTGCLGSDGACGSTVPRIEPGAAPVRGCNGSVRAALVSSWGNLFQGDDCANGACPNGLRQAYRRDDFSGTSAVFLELMGAVGRSLNGRATVFNLSGLTAIPNSFAFCDGGQLEGFWPDPNTASGQANGDPLHKSCAAEDDLCGASGVKSSTSPIGTLGLVRAIRSPVPNGFAVAQCEKGKFSPIAFAGWNTTQPVCPDGTAPKGGTCRLPFWEIGDLNGDGDTKDAGERNYNCMNPRNNPDPKLGANGVDGRAYNWVMRTQAGVVTAISGSTTIPEVSQWRQNTNTLNEGLGGNLGGLFAASNKICQEADATRQIGCLVGNTTCTIGFATRDAVSTDPFDDLQEPVRLNGLAPNDQNILAVPGYPARRDMFINAIGGFENLSFDCLDRGGSVNYCADQTELTLEFYNMTDEVKNACRAAGFVPFVTPRCDGMNHSAAANCGAPKVQAVSECQPL